MTTPHRHTVTLEADYELPVVIVWDALVEPILVEGWLASARIDQRLGGEFTLSWRDGTQPEFEEGLIELLQPEQGLKVVWASGGSLQFELTGVVGGSRGSSTRLRVSIVLAREAEAAEVRELRALWRARLGALEGLLRGHPVQW